ITPPPEDAETRSLPSSKVEFGVLVFLEYIEKVNGRRDEKITVVRKKHQLMSPLKRRVSKYEGILPQKAKEAVARAYEAGINRGRIVVQRGLRYLLSIGDLFSQINNMTREINVLGEKLCSFDIQVKLPSENK
ncbi:MAG: hypothetical protein HQ510_04745, partial [Candidatus Marinimicrobia bacterium]|nr:hypothetical protein [Candidatus Neomarinimicrobiota bacterium]